MSTGPSALDQPQAVQPTVAPSAVERLFAQDPLPPAPATDERLPIFEAMESEWFRRRDEARAQAAMAHSSTILPPLPTMPRSVASSPSNSLGSGGGSGGNGGGFGGRGGADTNGVTPAGAGTSNAGSSVSSAPSVPSGPASPMPPVSPPPSPVAPAPSAPPPAQMPAPPASAPVQPPAPFSAPAGFPVQPLAASATPETSAADSRGAKPVENNGTWSSPGDEGWKAAQAAAKPVAAGLTQKGLPKRVPKSNLVPGSAGGAGAAKATPPVIPPRSADAVRGRLSSFHQGLRHGRDAATSPESESGSGDGNDRKDA
jgi:hypothetical protein